MAPPMDSVMSPETAIMVERLGGVGVPDLKGLWTHYEGPTEASERIHRADPSRATSVLQEVYRAPVKPELITEQLTQIHASGVVVAGRLSPAQTQRYWRTVAEASMDLVVIRGSFVSAEHVSGSVEPLNLKRFIHELNVSVIVGGVATCIAALHLTRTDAAGILVGQGGDASSSMCQVLELHMPMAIAVASVAETRRGYLGESGGHYAHVIADDSVGNSGNIVKAIACGADTVMLGAALVQAKEAPGGGYRWGTEARHERLPRGFRSHMGTVGTIAEILNGPSDHADGTLNLMDALRRTLATTGYVDVKEPQRVEVVLAPYTSS